ncbi:MAG: hypothetical protein C4570_05070 [Ammonifex sp.]|jgi:hypothetical protein|nr:MAG: hypothetical protein C4570_05070 [Ammonifex sp.]
MDRTYKLREQEVCDGQKICDPEVARRDYYAGKISAEEYIKVLKESPEGDHARREIEKQFRKLVAPVIKKA